MIDIFSYTKLGQVFFASNQAAVTLSALSTTATGFILSNPVGSGKNIAVLSVQWAFQTAPAGASVVGIAMSPGPQATNPTHTTPINAVQMGALYGSTGNSVAKVDTAATTVGTPVFARMLGGPVAASQINPPYINDNVDGALILLPGCSIQLAYVTTAAVGLASMTWLEYNP